MRQIHPTYADNVDPAAAYAGDPRTAPGAPAPVGRPWVMINMISSADGATSVDGVSGPLGGPADKRVFSAIRAVADVILVGAGTVRAENYGPPRHRGARLAVVTSSLALDPRARLFAAGPGDQRPIVFTSAAAPPERRAALNPVAEVIDAGESTVDLGAALAELHRRGARVVLCEGGPSLNGQLVAAGLVDELCLTLAPVLASGEAARVAHGPVPPAPLRLGLDRILEEDGLLFVRYVVARDGG